jgi:hypothetical protein
MSLNDREDSEFDSSIEDESVYPMSATEIGKIRVHRGHPQFWDNEMGDLEDDWGSGSMAEHSAIMPGDGRLEVAEDKVMLASDMEIGYSNGGRENVEIGEYGIDHGRYGIGEAGIDYGRYGIGEDLQAPFESFMLGPNRMGEQGIDEGRYGIGEAGIDHGRYGIGAAMVKVVETARNNRLPPPPMRATDINDESDVDDDWDLTQTMVGAAAASGNPDPFPLTSQFMLRAGSGMEPRFVRVDTEESYKAFRHENSPEMSELRDRVDDLHAKVDAHINDPDAHGGSGSDGGMIEADLEDDIEDIALLGAEVQAAEHDKRVELWMPKRFDGMVEAWREGDFVCASIAINGLDGEVKILTSLEPIRKCVDEMAKHAADAGATSEVVGVLPAMGCVLGAGTAIKEMAAGARSIAEKNPVSGDVFKIEPKMNPAICALAMLAMACRAGNQQACQEWSNLAALSPAPVKQAMVEAMQIAKASE